MKNHQIITTFCRHSSSEMYLLFTLDDGVQRDGTDDMDFQSAKKRFRTPTGVILSVYMYIVLNHWRQI